MSPWLSSASLTQISFPNPAVWSANELYPYFQYIQNTKEILFKGNNKIKIQNKKAKPNQTKTNPSKQQQKQKKPKNLKKKTAQLGTNAISSSSTSSNPSF